MADDGTEASVLANLCARLGFAQRAALQQIVSDAAAGTGRCSDMTGAQRFSKAVVVLRL
jgi:hypothetical protein